MLDVPLYSIDIYACVVCVLTLVFNQKNYIGISTLINLEESCGDSSEPFTGNSVTLFGYT